MAAARQAHGAYGEELAARWYRSHGYAVLDRNWRHGRAGELDLVLGAAGLVVFCEVKARASVAYGDGFAAVTADKQRRLRRLGVAWLAAHPADGRRDIRFDVASVLAGKLTVLEAAF